jgi:hypothetical protein
MLPDEAVLYIIDESQTWAASSNNLIIVSKASASSPHVLNPAHWLAFLLPPDCGTAQESVKFRTVSKIFLSRCLSGAIYSPLPASHYSCSTKRSPELQHHSLTNFIEVFHAAGRQCPLSKPQVLVS